MSIIDQAKYIMYRKMEVLEETDNITKNIVKEIVRECKAKKTIMDENFCIYYVKLLLLDPRWGITAESQLNREKVSKLVYFCIEEFLRDECPCISTLLSQHFFMSKAQNRHDMILQDKLIRTERIQSVKDKILNFEMTEDSRMQEKKLFSDIRLYIILYSLLGSAQDPVTERETSSALRSVFEESELNYFTKLSKLEKEEYLEHITKVVFGIRIFHIKNGRSIGNGVDLQVLISGALERLESAAQNDLKMVMERVNILTLVIDKCFQVEPNAAGGYWLVRSGQKFHQSFVRKLIFYRQFELYIRRVLIECEQIKKHSSQLFEVTQKNILLELHKITKYKMLIPVNQVFPLFHDLAECEGRIRDEMLILSTFSNLYTMLHAFSKRIVFKMEDFAPYIENETILTDAMRLEKTTGLRIKQSGNKCRVLDIEEMDFKHTFLEYLGFCPWSLVETDGGLIPGNPNMGVLKWKDKYYVFSSLEAAETFGMNPDRYILSILEISRKFTELIHLLQLYYRLQSVKTVPVLYEKPAAIIATSEAEVQTELHPIPKKIDPTYRWNVWDLYRDAIKWANISECRTHSTQTYKSHWRVPAKVQTTHYRDKGLQTKKDNYTNVPTLSSFMFGLRGRTDDNQHMIDLTRPVDE